MKFLNKSIVLCCIIIETNLITSFMKSFNKSIDHILYFFIFFYQSYLKILQYFDIISISQDILILHNSMEQKSSLLENINEQPIINYHNLICEGNQLANFVCSSVGCLQCAFRCINTQCVCNKDKHNQCSLKIEPNEFIFEIQKNKTKVLPEIQEIFDSIILKYDEMIEKASLDRLQFIDFTHNFGLTQDMHKVLKLINAQQTQKINGQFINKIMKSIKSPIYSPIYLSNYEQIRTLQIQIQHLFNKLSYDLANIHQKYNKASQRFGTINQNSNRIQKRNKHWEFIPTQIEIFSQLKDVDLCCNSIIKITSLQNCIHLQELWLQYNHIKKIQNLSHLTSLKKLYLRFNNIQKIQNLDTLVNLQYLGLNSNNINKIQNLDKLVKLEWLSLNNNQITIVENLEDLVSLSTLWIVDNPLIKTQNGHQMLLNLKKRNLKKLTLPSYWTTQ